MKKVAVGLLIAFLCSFSFAGKITYACGCTVKVDGGTNNMTSNEKCPKCSHNAGAQEKCEQFFNAGTGANIYNPICLPESN